MATDAEILEIVAPQIMRDEGCRLTAYQDTVGVWTVGYGCTGPDIVAGVTWTQAHADDELAKRVDALLLQLDLDLSWWRTLDAPRGAVLPNMAFNLGMHGLLGFPHMLAAAQAGNWVQAADEMRNSRWAEQVPNRAARLAMQMQTGIVQ